jgi:chorismate lyase/3-hydroxybenzoate synthase
MHGAPRGGAPFSVAYIDEAQARLEPVNERLLAQIRYAAAAPDRIIDTRDIVIPLVSLGNSIAERWYSNLPLESGFEHGIAYRKSAAALFGHLVLPEDSFADLGATAFAAYRHIASLSANHGYGHMLRIWNYFPQINGRQASRERYKRFCDGRRQALDALRHRDTLLPAACAIGTRAPGLRIYFLAAREPGVQVENPRQMSAFHYPEQYGPKSPAFSRAILKQWGRERHLYISGTASIAGHRSLHAGDSLRQLEETLANLKALTETAGEGNPGAFSLIRGALLKMYVRPGQDQIKLKQRLLAVLGPDFPVMLLAGDICRSELLVEIEGVLRQASGPAIG